jgi:hypothetical protein
MQTRKIGRDARTGRFIPLRVARSRRRTTTVETYWVTPRGVLGRGVKPASDEDFKAGKGQRS